MISFYPGPSKLHPRMSEFMARAVEQAVPSLNHRSGEFTKIIQDTVKVFKKSLKVPDEYMVYFISSATEAWEIIGQSFLTQHSYHAFNGAFGAKWADYTEKLGHKVTRESFDLNHLPSLGNPSATEAEMLCLTYCETSNGTMLNPGFAAATRNKFPNALISYDCTSAIGGVQVPFEEGDIWFASVQKCLGLPPGMGLLICSPKAIERGLEIGENTRYNSFVNLHKNGVKSQTTHTPNTLGIYLLGRICKYNPPIDEIHQLLEVRAAEWYTYFESVSGITRLISCEETRATTVVALKMDPDALTELKNAARRRDIILGRGYGDWLHQTFRIANFPAITSSEIQLLKDFLTQHTTL